MALIRLLGLAVLLALGACGGAGAPAPAATEAPAAVETPAPEPAAPQTEAPAPAPAAVLVTPENLEITTDNAGEDDQHVNFILTFDGDASAIAAEDFAATIADTEVEAEKISVAVDGNTATVTLNPFAIKAGKIELEYNGEAAVPFAVHAIVSPGMNVEVVEQDAENASVTMRISELFHVRGVGRVMLVENGEVVMTQTEEPAKFTAVHGHEFLTLDGPAIAEKMVFSLGENFPEGYTFTADGDTVTVTKLNAEGPVELMLKIQQSSELEIK